MNTLFSQGKFAFEGRPRLSHGGLTMYTFRRQLGSSNPSLSMICSKEGNNERMNTEVLDKGYHLRCKP